MTTPACPLPIELRSLLPVALHEQCALRSFERGQRLFEIGHRPTWLHFVSDGEVVLQRRGEDAGFALRWIGMLNQEVRRLRQQCERLILKTVEARLVHLLRADSGTSGLGPSGGLKALAHELGVTHEALYRCVAVLEKRGELTRIEGRLLLQASNFRPKSGQV